MWIANWSASRQLEFLNLLCFSLRSKRSCTNVQNSSAQPEFCSLRTGTLATQASSVSVDIFVSVGLSGMPVNWLGEARRNDH